MRVELSTQQIDSLLLSTDAALSHLEFARTRNAEYADDIQKDLELIGRIREKISRLNPEGFIPFTKYEIYTLINIASDYEGMHQQPQDPAVKNVSSVKLNILDVIKSPLPYINVIFIKSSKG